MPYHCYIDINESILESDNRKITKPIAVLDTLELPHGQPTLNIPRKRKIKNYSSLNSIPTHKAHGLTPSNNTQVAIEP